MDIKIQSIGNHDGKEYGMDQYKNVYNRNILTTAWDVVHEYRRVPNTRQSSSKDMKLLAERGLFSFAVDADGQYWKKYLHYPWKEMIYEDLPKYGLTSTIIGLLAQNYWSREPNGTIIKRYCDIPLREEPRRKSDPNFYTFVTPKKIIKRRKIVTKGIY